MVSIYGYQNRPARKFFQRSKTTCKKMFCPTKKNTCSNDYPITLAGQLLSDLNEFLSVSAGGDFFSVECRDAYVKKN
jgi:hypothetical protein